MLKRLVLIVLGLSFTLAAVGCESMGMKKDSGMMSEKGVIAISNHGSVVFVPTDSGVQMLSTTGDTSCAQCKADAADYFKTGKLTEKCSACGATRYPLMRGK